jgi:hypothetical protein
VTDLKLDAYLAIVYKQMLDDLTWPVAKDGSTMQTDGIKAWVCWHLVRTGWRKPNNTNNFPLVEEYDDPLIKPRKVYGPGVFEGAIRWVSVTDPDDPLEGLENMTVGQIEALPDDVKFEAKRRLGMLPPVEPSEPTPAWTVRPNINITDEPEPEDVEWSTT